MEKTKIVKAITKKFEEEGFDVREELVDKVSCPYNSIAIRIPDTNIYGSIDSDAITNLIIEGKYTVDEIVEEYISFLKTGVHNGEVQGVVHISEGLKNKDYVLEHIRVRFGKGSSSAIKRMSFLEGIEEFLCIYVERERGGYSFVSVDKNLLNHVGLTEEEAWSRAEENVNNSTVIVSGFDFFCQSIADKQGLTKEEVMEDLKMVNIDENFCCYMVSNTEFCCGASCVRNKKAIKEKFNSVGIKENVVMVCPSSVHECIIFPVYEGMSIDIVSEFVREVNEMLADYDVLSDRAYMLEL